MDALTILLRYHLEFLSICLEIISSIFMYNFKKNICNVRICLALSLSLFIFSILYTSMIIIDASQLSYSIGNIF